MSTLPASLIAFRDAISAEYSDVRPLGAGGMATVLLAEERALKRLVAIKVLDSQLAQDPTYRTRFAREKVRGSGANCAIGKAELRERVRIPKCVKGQRR